MYSRYLPPITFSIIVLSLSLIVHADDFSKKQRELEAIEKKIDLQTLDSEKLDKRNKSLFADIRKIQEELVKSAKLIQNGETELSLIEEKITQESDILDKSRRSIFSKRQTISQLFAALERVALESPSRLIFYPDRPIKKIHSIMLMRSYLRTLQDRISSLNDGFEKVNNLIDNLSFQKDQLVANLNNLDLKRIELQDLLDKKSVLSQKLSTEKNQIHKKTTELKDEAKSLEELIQNLRAKPIAKESTPEIQDAEINIAMKVVTPVELLAYSGFPFRKAKGKVILPAQGKVTLKHDPLEDAKKMQGIYIVTRKNAQVVSPYDGKVIFADDFRDYGKLLIISHGDGYHTLLAGMSKITCKPDEKVIVGEPVGVMGSVSNASNKLYMEVLHIKKPIDFLPWLAKENVVG